MPQPRVAAPLQVVAAVGFDDLGRPLALGRWISSLARLRAAGGVLFHDDRRSHDRERCAPDDRAQAAFLGVEPAVGGDRVRADLRRLPAPGRARRGPPGTSSDHDDRARALHGRVARRGACDQRRVPDCDARAAGAGGGGGVAGGALDRDEHVQRGRRAQQGAWHLGWHRRPGRHGRADRGWICHPLRRLAVHLLPQRADRRGRFARGEADRSGEPPGWGAASFRRARRCQCDRRAARSRVRDLKRVAGRLGGSFFGFVFVGTLYMQQVLGYSALQAGVAWLATSLTSLALAGLSQKLVTRISPGPVMALGMAVIGGGILWATLVLVHGHFWGSLAGPFFVAGAGGAFSFIPISIGGLTGVAEREAGLASGLLNTSQQLGGAIGVAVGSTVAATHMKTLLAGGDATSAALTGGFQWAFWVCGAIALLAPATTALILRGKRRSEVEGAVPALEVGGVN